MSWPQKARGCLETFFIGLFRSCLSDDRRSKCRQLQHGRTYFDFLLDLVGKVCEERKMRGGKIVDLEQKKRKLDLWSRVLTAKRRRRIVFQNNEKGKKERKKQHSNNK